MNCELCGKDAELYLAEVEGTMLSVCNNCKKFGKVIKKIAVETPRQEKDKARGAKIVKVPEKELIEVIVPNYAELIKKKREKLGLKQKDFAKLISEKESLLSKIETREMEPSVALARKLERILKIKLVEVLEEAAVEKKEAKGEELTIGDLVKVKSKKRKE